MNEQIFFKLLLTKKFDIGNGIDNFSFSCKSGNYEMTFGINDGVISFEDFGVVTGKGWEQLEPTDNQLETVTAIVNSYIAMWDTEIQPRERFKDINDIYDYCGVKRSEFF
jgi:hypothetical protein